MVVDHPFNGSMLDIRSPPAQYLYTALLLFKDNTVLFYNFKVGAIG